MTKIRLWIVLFLCVALVSTGSVEAKMLLGMNVDSSSYYEPTIIFNDAMKSASFVAADWSGTTFALFPKDSNGYPTEVPFTINGTAYRYYALFNTFYAGEYVLLYDGEGDVTIGGGVLSQSVVNGNRHFVMPETKVNAYVIVSSVTTGNHVRNMRIIPVAYLGNEAEMPVFNSDFLAGLQPFHSLRFMNFTRTNGSVQQEWINRPTPTYATQSSSKGAAWEYVIQMANQLNIDPWICIPHMASDDYIVQLATLFKNTLEPDRKIYLEFSNEMWNWIFTQAGYVVESAPGHPNSYVTKGLAGLGTTKAATVSGSTFSGMTLSNGNKVMLSATGSMPEPLQAYTQYFVVNASGTTFQLAATSGGAAITLTTPGSGVRVHYSDNFPEKDAYMMARVFRLFGTVFGEPNDRVVRVAAGQQGWPDNSRRILQYLFTVDGIGADALAVGGYFNFDPADHATWVALDPATVTPEMILQSAANYYPTHERQSTLQSAAYAKQYGVDYMVYEGGQHMQPYNQGEWAYNHAVWDAQIHPGMYDMYMTNFATHTDPEVDCKLFMAFSYVGGRESRYGSWGHLENLGQLDSPSTLMITAPKYQALLNWAKSSRRLFRNVRVGEVEP